MKLFLSKIMVVIAFVMVFFCTNLAPAVAQDPNPGASGPIFYSNTNPYFSKFQGQCTWYVWGRCAQAGWPLNNAPDATTEYSGYGTKGNISNGSGKGMTPSVGSIECVHYSYIDPKTKKTTIGYHVAYVYHVDPITNPALGITSWEIAQWNVPIGNGYTFGTVTRSSSSSTLLSGGGFKPNSYSLDGFLYPPKASIQPAPPSNTEPLYRLSNSSIGQHFYTIDTNERAALINGGWRDEGIACHVQITGANGWVPFTRWRNTSTQAHLYTCNPAEISALQGDPADWVRESDMGYVSSPTGPQPSNTVGLFRFCCDTYMDHFYTETVAEVGGINGNGNGSNGTYRGEGCSAWVWP